MEFDEYEQLLNEKIPERASPFRETLGQLIVGDLFKCLATDMPQEVMWQVTHVDYDWKIVRAVLYEERYREHMVGGPSTFDFNCQVVRYKLV